MSRADMKFREVCCHSHSQGRVTCDVPWVGQVVPVTCNMRLSIVATAPRHVSVYKPPMEDKHMKHILRSKISIEFTINLPNTSKLLRYV